MSTLQELEDRVAKYYRDTTHAIVTNTEIDEALQQALDDLTLHGAHAMETVIQTIAAGREIALNGIDGLLGVSQVWWPFNPTTEVWPPKLVEGFKVIWDDNQPVLLFPYRVGLQPAANDYIRLWYTVRHTIEGLNGGEITTVIPYQESLLVRGAVAYATLSKSLDLRTDQRLVDNAKLLRQEFWNDLKVMPRRSGNYDFGGVTGWTIDGYDSLRGRTWREQQW